MKNQKIKTELQCTLKPSGSQKQVCPLMAPLRLEISVFNMIGFSVLGIEADGADGFSNTK